jgi:hypothetical protein
MVRTFLGSAIAACLAVAPAWGADARYSIKLATTPVPSELKEPIRTLLSDHAIQLADDKGKTLCELWFRKEVPAKATPEQVKNGLTYRELEETTLLGAMRIDQLMTDYRKQKIKPGVYTLRLGFQPMDGDHMGTAPYNEFCLVVPAALDQKPDTMEAKELQEMSNKAARGTHPGVFLLYPNNKPEGEPQLVNKGEDTWVLNFKEETSSNGQKAPLGLGLTLIGHSEQQ